MGLLADIFSTIDSKKRKLRGLLSDPVEALYQGVRNFGEDQRGLLDTQAQAYPFMATPEQKARIATFKRTPEQARKELSDAGAAQGMAATINWPGAPKVVYHGSGKEFDKFDRSMIQSNTKANDAGVGWHFSDNKSDAGFYADMGARNLGLDSGHVGKWDLNMKNPLVVGIDAADGNAPEELIQKLLDDKLFAKRYATEAGHDGIIYPYGTNVDSAWTAILFDGDKATKLK